MPCVQVFGKTTLTERVPTQAAGTIVALGLSAAALEEQAAMACSGDCLRPSDACHATRTNRIRTGKDGDAEPESRRRLFAAP